MYHTDTGVILFSTSYSDSDKMFKVFTKEIGLIPVFGKGVKKINSRRSYSLDTLNLVKANFYQKGDYFYVNDTALLKDFSSIRSNIILSSWVFYVFEVINSILVENEPDLVLYNNLITALDSLNTNPKKRVLYKYLELLVRKQGFWDPEDIKKHPYLKAVYTSDLVSAEDQLSIDSFFNSKLESVVEKKLNSVLLIKSLE